MRRISTAILSGGNFAMPIGQYIISRNDTGYTRDQAVTHGGTLAVITSIEKNTLVLGFLAQDELLWGLSGSSGRFGPWIGLSQAPGSAEPGGGWAWDTGETYDFTAWHSGQPDNFFGDSFACFWNNSGSIDRADHITDFTVADGDKIDLSQIDGIAGGGFHHLVFIGTAAFTALGQVRYEQIGGQTIIETNLSGTKQPEFYLVADDLLTLDVSAFVL